MLTKKSLTTFAKFLIVKIFIPIFSSQTQKKFKLTAFKFTKTHVEKLREIYLKKYSKKLSHTYQLSKYDTENYKKFNSIKFKKERSRKVMTI